jgi:putative DNA-invertase from lambdoid prophage Rac
MQPKAVIYSRVSTGEQHSENQLPELKETIARREHELTAVYEESESAWKAGHQHELARLVDDARRGRVDLLYVWALDRLSREGPLAILSLIHTLKLYGVKVISLKESWTEAPGELGELLYAIAGWVAQQESKRRSERTKAGMERVRLHGSKSGIGIGKRGPDKAGTKRKRRRKSNE